MKITRKTLVLAERNTKDRIEARKVYSMDVSRIADENLVFLDETGFNEHSRRSYGYSLINTKDYITVPANRNINRSLLCTISKDGVIAHECRKGSYNGDSILIFINTHLVPYFIDHPNSVLIMDILLNSTRSRNSFSC